MDEDLITRWTRGESVPGVSFAKGAHVRILEGPFNDEVASVGELVSLTPEPCYALYVEATNVHLELAQSALASE